MTLDYSSAESLHQAYATLQGDLDRITAKTARAEPLDLVDIIAISHCVGIAQGVVSERARMLERYVDVSDGDAPGDQIVRRLPRDIECTLRRLKDRSGYEYELRWADGTFIAEGSSVGNREAAFKAAIGKLQEVGLERRYSESDRVALRVKENG